MKTTQEFLSQTHCDRCKCPLNVPGSARTMSWFTEETICVDVCSKQESEIKKALRLLGISTMEGCGFVPEKGKHY